MHVLIIGATGLIGRALSRHLSEKGYAVVAVGRNPDNAKRVLGPTVEALGWGGDSTDRWAERIEGAAAIINLAGENIGEGRWNASKRERILNSRLQATRTVIRAIEAASHRPSVLIQASAIGYYGHQGEEVKDESTPMGKGFLAGLCKDWEAESLPASDLGVRRVLLRTGVVLSSEDGALPKMLAPIKAYLGGPLGSGKQWISWIHIGDMVRTIEFLIENNDLQGAFNITAPEPVTNKDLTELIAKRLKRPAFMPVPAFSLKLLFGRDFAEEMLLGGRKVFPHALQKAGFEFDYKSADAALNDLLK